MTNEAAEPASAIPDEDVARLLPALAEAERATEETAARFVPPRPGILEEVSARRHQLVLGRRGVGKSTLLLRVAAGGPENGRAVIFVDVETLRGRPYPDVLIELLKELLDHLEERLRADGAVRSWHRRKLLRRVRTLSAAMSQLLEEPHLAEHTVTKLRSQRRQAKTDWSFKAGACLSGRRAGLAGEADVDGGTARVDEKAETAEATVAATFHRTKMDGLVESAIFVREVLSEAQKELAIPTLVVLDDFYHIALDDQAEVLAYLHQVVKGLDISLKVCGVERLLRPFAAGDPPVGMQPEQDAGVVRLDITLERFQIAKSFLEQVLVGICAPVAIEIDTLVTEGGRERLVLASGGVARDYISLARRALRASTERPSHQWRVKNRITAEDVAQAATEAYDLKQEELKRDAADGAEALRSRLAELVRFCVEMNRTNVFLVETTRLQEEEWGKEVQALADLRFVHRVATLSTHRGGTTYPGRKFAAFTLDLSVWTSTRSEQIRPINFWERQGRERIRAPRLIYTPALATPPSDAATADDGSLGSALAEGEQLTLDSEPAYDA